MHRNVLAVETAMHRNVLAVETAMHRNLLAAQGFASMWYVARLRMRGSGIPLSNITEKSSVTLEA
jgi:hypothetical protein